MPKTRKDRMDASDWNIKSIDAEIRESYGEGYNAGIEALIRDLQRAYQSNTAIPNKLAAIEEIIQDFGFDLDGSINEAV